MHSDRFHFKKAFLKNLDFKHLISDWHWYFILLFQEQCLKFCSFWGRCFNLQVELTFPADVFSFNFHFFSSLYLSLGFSLSQEQYCLICISTRCHASYLAILFLYVPGHTAEISSANPLVKLGTDSAFLGLVFDLWHFTERKYLGWN